MLYEKWGDFGSMRIVWSSERMNLEITDELEREREKSFRVKFSIHFPIKKNGENIRLV